LGRRSRWHQILSKYDLTVGYISGKENTVADILSRWAYPASQVNRDISKHGNELDKQEMKTIIKEEEGEERECMVIKIKKVAPIRRRSATKDPVPDRFQFKNPLRKPAESAPSVGTSQGRPETGTTETETEGTRETESETVEETQDLGEEGEMGVQPNSPTIQEEHLSYQQVEEMDWSKHYLESPKWSEIWKETQEPYQTQWPKGVHIQPGRMFLDDRLCIPEKLQKPWIRAHHVFLGHVGADRVWAHMENRFAFANPQEANQFTQWVSSQCETCQACQRATQLKGPIQPTPIPKAVMHSVALDLFRMSQTVVGQQTFDTMIVCVDRHSGWIVAIPMLYKGTTGETVAKEMLKQQWRPFGVPALVTSDQGSHFISSWWQNLCAGMGVRQVYSQAYHHQANGRAEVAGQQLMEVLRKLHVEQNLNWVEALPQALDRIHDVKGQSGLSPYQILFGRERPMEGLPLRPWKECEDAQEFMARMWFVHTKVSKELTRLHERQAKLTNASRTTLKPLDVGDKVWYRRPENSGEKTDTRWVGPCMVTARQGEHSYEIRLDQGEKTTAHRTFLKEYIEDTWNGEPIDMFYHQRTVTPQGAQPNEYIVEEVKKHRVNAQGRLEFLTQWKGETTKEATWEPVNSFFHRYGTDIIKYCKKVGLALDVTQYLRSEPEGGDV